MTLIINGRFFRHRMLFASIPALLLVACSGGSGGGASSTGDSDTTTRNISATSLEIVTAAPTIAYPFEAELEITSNETIDNVDVSLFAIEKKSDPDASEDPDAEEPREFPIGSVIVPQLLTGSNRVNLQVNIPSTVEIEGQYYIVAIVDAAETLTETDKEDNTFAIEATLLAPPDPNMHVVDLTLDHSSLEISTTSYEEYLQTNEDAGDVYNADAGATLTVGADGLPEDAGIDIKAFANLRIVRTDTNTQHDVPLYLWNSDAARYMNAYGVDPDDGGTSTDIEWLPLGSFSPQRVTEQGAVTHLEDVDRNAALLNFYFPGKLGSVLEYAMRYAGRSPPGGSVVLDSPLAPSAPPPDLGPATVYELNQFLGGLPHNGIYGDETAAEQVLNYSICVQIRAMDTAVDDQNAVDNERCAPLVITLPPLPVAVTSPAPGDEDDYAPWRSRSTTAMVHSPKPFNRTVGGSTLKAGVDFGNAYRADYRGYVQDMHGRVPIWIFGRRFDYFRADIHAQLLPDFDWQPGDILEDLAGLPLDDLENVSYVHAEIWHAGMLLSNSLIVPNNTGIETDVFDELTQISYSRELPDPDTGSIAESTIFVGPIPLSAGAYVTGNLGIRYPALQLRADPSADEDLSDDKTGDYFLGLEGGPFADLSGTMYAGFGSRRPIFPVIFGIEGRLSLLDEYMVFSDGVTIDGRIKVSEDDPQEFLISRGPKITNIFTGPQGRINLFVEYKVIKIGRCKVGIFRIPCPKSKRIKVSKLLYKSPALFRFEDVLYSDPNLELDVVLYPGQAPLYFSGNDGPARIRNI